MKKKVQSEKVDKMLATQFLHVQEEIQTEVLRLEQGVNKLVAEFMSSTGIAIDSISIGWEDENYEFGDEVCPADIDVKIEIEPLELYKPSRHEPKEGKKEKYRDELGR